MPRSKSGSSTALQRKINEAARGPIVGMASKIWRIADYILATSAKYGGNLDEVPCPSPDEWAALARGYHPMLPSPLILRLFADEGMRNAAGEPDGSIEKAYFEAARLVAMKRRSKRQ